MPRGKLFVQRQPLLRQGKGLLAHQGRHWDFDPLLSRAPALGWIAPGLNSLEPAKAVEPLRGWPFLGFPKTSPPLIGWVPQHGPQGRVLPHSLLRTSGNLLRIEHPNDAPNALVLAGIKVKNLTNHFRFTGHHFIISLGRLALLNIAIAVRSGRRQYIQDPSPGLIALTPPAALGNLRPFILGNHALKLDQQTLFRSLSCRRFQKEHLSSMPGKLLQ